MAEQSVYFVILGCSSFVASWISLFAWGYIAEQLTRRCREHYVAAIVRQDVGFFDLKKPAELSSELAADSQDFLASTGEKVSTCIQHLSTVFTGIIIGFVRGWQLALVVLGILPFMAASMGAFTKVLQTFQTKGNGMANGIC